MEELVVDFQYNLIYCINMPLITLTIKQPKADKFLIELDAKKFERMAANFGLFSDDFVKSLERAEKDYKTGRTKKIKSLKELRK